MEWTDQETTTLISLWPTSSAEQIAKRLQCSRSAVVGKAKRLRAEGVLPFDVVKHYEINPRPSKHRRSPRPRISPPLQHSWVISSHDSVASRSCTLIELDDSRCPWPLGELHQVAAMFCGGVSAPRHRYCEHHARMAVKGDARGLISIL